MGGMIRVPKLTNNGNVGVKNLSDPEQLAFTLQEVYQGHCVSQTANQEAKHRHNPEYRVEYGRNHLLKSTTTEDQNREVSVKLSNCKCVRYWW